MRHGRPVRYVVIWLLLLPAVMAASDTTERAADGDFFRIPHLGEHESYVYDAVLRSHHNDLEVRVEDYLQVEVGTVAERSVQGHPFRVLPVTTIQGWGPWDSYATTRPLGYGSEPEWITTTTTEWIDVASGAVVESHTHDQVTFHSGEDEPETLVLDDHRTTYTPRGGIFDWGMWPGEAIATPIDGFLRVLGDLMRVQVPVAEKGILDGATVHNAKTWGHRPGLVAQGDHASCSVYYPEVWYQDFALAKKLRGRPVWTDERSDAWVSPDHALPVLQECRLLVRQGDADGPLVEDLHLALVLAEHRPGEAEVPIPFGHLKRATLDGPLQPAPPAYPGVPQDGDSGLGYPLHEAVQQVLDYPGTAAYLQNASGDLRVSSATYEHSGADADPPGEPVLPPELTQAIRDAQGETDEGPSSSERWRLELLSDDGRTWRAVTTRSYDDEGRTVSTAVDGAEEGYPRTYGIAPTDAPLVPLGILLDHHLEPSQEVPRSFQITWSSDTEEHHLVTPAPMHQPPEGHRISAVDGRTISSWQRDETRTEGAPTHPYATLTGTETGLVPVVDRGTLAVASGVMLTGILAITYFWELIVRFLLHGSVALYAKVDRGKALDHPRRRDIHDLVSAEPGITVKTIRERLGLGHGAVMFHLATLEHVGLLSSTKTGRTRAWFIPGQVDHHAQGQVALLASPAVRRVHETLLGHPGIHQAALAERLRLKPATLRFHLRRLEAAGLVRKETGEGRSEYHAVAPRDGPGPVSSKRVADRPTEAAANA